jgi:hypothetical protein
MASQMNISLNENNDEAIRVVITTNVPTVGTTLDITGMSLEAYLKPNASTADTDPAVWKGTSGGGQITVTDAPNGKATISVPASAVTLTQGWWRCDTVSGGLRKTAVYGVLSVVNL